MFRLNHTAQFWDPFGLQVTDLRARLGGSAVPCPKMDIGAAFSGIAAKALGIAGFFPYNTDLNFLLGEPQELPATPLQ